MEFRVIATFNNGDSNLIETFKTEKEANDFFNLQLKSDADTDNCYDLEIDKITFDEDGEIDDNEIIRSQTMFAEGEIDRYDNKEKSPLIYGYEAVWNAEKKELEYTLYFQGKREEKTVLDSELINWYY